MKTRRDIRRVTRARQIGAALLLPLFILALCLRAFWRWA